MSIENLHILDKIIGAYIPFLALLFTIILFFLSNENSRSKRILGYYMLINTLYYGYLFFYYSTYYSVILDAYYLIVPVALLIQPFFYLYIKSLTNPDFRCNYKQILHLIPSLIILIMNISLYSFLNRNEQMELMAFNTNSGNEILDFYIQLHSVGYHILFGIQALIYLSVVIWSIYKHRKNLSTNFSNYEGVNLNWLIMILSIFILGSVVQESLGYIDQLVFNIYARIYYNIFSLFIIAFIGISAIKQKEIYKISCDKPPSKKYKHSSLNDDSKNDLMRKLEAYLTNEKPYLNNDLKLDDIAKHLNTNRQYLSQVINENSKQNFYTLINDYRIEESKQLFFEKKHKQLSIMGVANSVGFNSKSTFNTLFKKSTGLTPSEFIKTNQL